MDEPTRKQLERGQRVTEVLKQVQYAPLKVSGVALSLFIADLGFLDDLPINKVLAFERELQIYMRSEHEALMNSIDAKPVYNDEVEKALKAAVQQFKATHTW